MLGDYRIGIAEKKDSGEVPYSYKCDTFHYNSCNHCLCRLQCCWWKYMGWNCICSSTSRTYLEFMNLHIIMQQKNMDVKSTLPYFVPAPTLIGTFGAVINVKSPIPNKNSLFDLGFSGPIAGIFVTIPVLIIGIYSLKNCSNSFRVHDIYSTSHYEHNYVFFDYLQYQQDTNYRLHPITLCRMGWNNSNTAKPYACCLP